MIDIKGIIPAIVTPMHADESINFKELSNQVERQIAAGAHGLLPIGTNGEFFVLSDTEKEEVLETTIATANKRLVIYAGTGCVSTRETIRLSKRANDMGADALSLICPYFAAASQDEIYEHYKSVAEVVPIPIVVYNIPARTGINIAPATIARLAKIDNIVGVKDSSGSFENILQYIEVTKEENFEVLAGTDSLILWNLMSGGAGAVTGIANIYPKTLVSIYESFQRGDLEEAKKHQKSIQNIRSNFKYGNPNTIVKTAVGLLGHPVGACRAPFNQVPQAGIEAIKQILEADKAKGMC